MGEVVVLELNTTAILAECQVSAHRVVCKDE